MKLSTKDNVLALHGFLGQGEDWGVGKNWQKPSLFDPNNKTNGPEWSLERWATKFFSETKLPKILLGYSLGGRLALHLYEQAPTYWESLILVSTHLGFTTQQGTEKKTRKMNDQKWAQKFRYEPWHNLIQEWNGQPIFSCEKNHPVRKEESFDREKLALAMENWSVSHQKDFRCLLSQIKIPVYYLVGEKDHQYVAFAEELKKLNPLIHVHIFPDKGHRILVNSQAGNEDQLSVFG